MNTTPSKEYDIRLALGRVGLLRSWKSDLEITSRNLVFESSATKDFDAVAEIDLDGSTHSFAIGVPYLRGCGPTRYRNQHTFRSGQQAALGKDVIDLLDALRVPQAILVGYDWGGRAARIAAAIWPERVRGLISSSGYAIQNIAKNASQPASPAVAYARWYQSYFNTEIGRIGFEHNRNTFCKLHWKLWSPTWRFTEEEYQQTELSFENPDFVNTVWTARC